MRNSLISFIWGQKLILRDQYLFFDRETSFIYPIIKSHDHSNLNCKIIVAMEEPQRCIKCNKLPQDILMLACSHDLCLDCAAERLSFELKKKKPANSIVCQICYEKTPLDPESIAELQRLIPAQKSTSVKASDINRVQKGDRLQRGAAKPNIEDRLKDRAYDRVPERQPERQPIRQYNYNSQAKNGTSSNLPVSNISVKKSCVEHPDEDILYFCFDCLCECICPECVIHGKHKDHDVKTIKKAHPAIKGELDASIGKIQSSIQNLLILKSEVDKNIRSFTDHNGQVKGQIKRAFDEVRILLQTKQKELLAQSDSNLNESIQHLQKGMKTIFTKIQELRGYSGQINDYMKKDEMILLNFYAKKGKNIKDEAKDVQINVPPKPSSMEKALASILQTTDYVNRIGYTADKQR